tara:strand:+ start:269 stop:1144 length:876 start_codon:yes stop_codon:yes gene_type:complete
MLTFYKLVLAIYILTSPGQALANSTDVLDNATEKKVEKKDLNKKIVTLTSLTTDIVSKLNNSYLIGIPGSRLTRKNKELLNKEIVTQGRTPPQLEKIISLNPDLVIGSASFHKKQLKKLSSIGIRSEGVEVKNWFDLINLIKKLSNLTNGDSSSVVSHLDNCNFKSNKNNNKVLILASAKPLLAPNSESWAGSLLDRFGIKNSTKMLESKSQFKGYVNLSPEWLISNQPEKIIVIKTLPDSIQSFIDLPYWSKLTAVKENNVLYMDYYGLINPGSIDSINRTCLTLSKINN